MTTEYDNTDERARAGSWPLVRFDVAGRPMWWWDGAYRYNEQLEALWRGIMEQDITVLQGDCRDMLKTLPDKSIQCCVTSPPYFGLRKYSDDPREIGQEAMPDCLAWACREPPCGACYVCAMRVVFGEVKRVLRDDGVLWLNLGDSYAANRSYQVPDSKHKDVGNSMAMRAADWGIPEKNLIGIPWRVALALQADGWILRSDCIWSKPNAMPESVRDRPTRAHEYLFLLSKSPRYFYDAAAIAEPVSAKTEWTYPQPDKAARAGITSNGTGASSLRTQPADGTRNRRTVWTISTRPYQEAHYAVFPEALIEPCILAGSLPTGAPEPDEFVYTPTGQGERLPDPSVETGRAGFNRPRRDTEGVRPMTRREQAAYAEQLKTSPYREHMEQEVGATTFAHYLRTDTSGARSIPPLLLDAWIDRGWLTSVNLPPRVVDISRSTVLDPFAGSGTTGCVALRLQRRAILIELNPEYVEEHIAKRTDGVQIEMFC